MPASPASPNRRVSWLSFLSIHCVKPPPLGLPIHGIHPEICHPIPDLIVTEGPRHKGIIVRNVVEDITHLTSRESPKILARQCMGPIV